MLGYVWILMRFDVGRVTFRFRFWGFEKDLFGYLGRLRP